MTMNETTQDLTDEFLKKIQMAMSERSDKIWQTKILKKFLDDDERSEA